MAEEKTRVDFNAPKSLVERADSVIEILDISRTWLLMTPHILCTLTTHEILPEEYVDAALTYFVETKGWDAQYVSQLRQQYLSG